MAPGRSKGVSGDGPRIRVTTQNPSLTSRRQRDVADCPVLSRALSVTAMFPLDVESPVRATLLVLGENEAQRWILRKHTVCS